MRAMFSANPNLSNQRGVFITPGMMYARMVALTVATAGVSEPFDLLSLDSYGTAQSYKHC
jgi:hypothetical protein